MLTPSTFRARGLIGGVLPFLLGGGSASFKTCMADDGKEKGACRVRPSPGPGSGVTAKTLAGTWAALPKQSDVVAFFEEDEAWGCFSNFYSDGHEYDFIIPQEFFAAGFRTEKERTVKCAFSEKAIMLCKAAVMNDEETFQLGSQEQGDARRKGFSISSQTRTPFEDAASSACPPRAPHLTIHVSAEACSSLSTYRDTSNESLQGQSRSTHTCGRVSYDRLSQASEFAHGLSQLGRLRLAGLGHGCSSQSSF